MIETNAMHSLSNGLRCEICKNLSHTIHLLTMCDCCDEDFIKFNDCCDSCLQEEMNNHEKSHGSIDVR